MRLIDADALIEQFNEKCDMATVLVDEKTAERFYTFCILADAVEDAPTIDTEPVRHGHWVLHTYEGFPLYYCSMCDNPRPHKRDNYCPKCGAKMDEVSE